MSTIIQDSETTVSTASGSATELTDPSPPPAQAPLAEAQAHEDGPLAQPSPPPPFDVVMSSRDPDALYSGGGIRCLSFHLNFI